MPTNFPAQTDRFLRPRPTTAPTTGTGGGLSSITGLFGGASATGDGNGSLAGMAGMLPALGGAVGQVAGAAFASAKPEQVSGVVGDTDYLTGQREDMAKQMVTSQTTNKAATTVATAINPAAGALVAATGAIGNGLREGNVDKYGFRKTDASGNLRSGLADAIDPIGNSTRAFSRLGDSDFSVSEKIASFVPIVGSFVTAGTERAKRDRILRRMEEANLQQAETKANSRYAGSGQLFQEGGALKKPAAALQPLTAPFTGKQEQQYEDWVNQLPETHRSSIDPATGNGRDYDYRRAFTDGVQASENGHFTDKYKLPNHRTFSTESLYYGPSTRDQAGSWRPRAGGGNTWVPLNPKVRQRVEESPDGRPILARKPARHADGGRIRVYGGGGKPGAIAPPRVAPAGSGTPLRGNPEAAKKYYDNALSTMQSLVGNKHDEVYRDPASGRECRANSCLSFASTVQEGATGQPVIRSKENLYNPAFTANAEQQGWTQIPLDKMQPGDRLQSWQPVGSATANEFKVADLHGRQLLPGRVPVHMTVFGGWQENGKPSAGSPGLATIYQDGHEFRNADSQVRPIDASSWVAYRYIGVNGQPTNNPQQAVALNPAATPRRQEGGRLLRQPAGPARSLIVTGPLHSQKHGMKGRDDVGTYGVPVVRAEGGGRLAEVEGDEYLMNEQLTERLEKLRAQYADSKDPLLLARIGKLVARDITQNTTPSPRYERRLAPRNA